MGFPDVVVTAAVADGIDTAELWRAHAAGAEGRRDVNKWTGELAERIAASAGRAPARAGGLPPATGCLVGSLYGSGHVAEAIRSRLDAGARSALAPESFVHFNAHGVTSLICLRHGLRGPSATLVGPGAGLQALAAAHRHLRLGADAPMLCGAYDLLSPAAAAALGGAPVAGAAAFLVLETATGARARGARVLGRLGPVGVFRREDVGAGPWTAEEGAVADGGAAGGPTAGGAPPEDVRATAPLAALVAALTSDGPAVVGPPLTVTAMGRRHAYRCTVYREG